MDFIRDYRNNHCQLDLIHFQVMVKETDLDIAIKKDAFDNSLIPLVRNLIIKYRSQLEEYIARDPGFASSLVPCKPEDPAPEIVLAMAHAAQVAGVGPMAAVAGAMSQAVGRKLLKYSSDVIVENGGDIYMNSQCKRIIGIYAGKSPFSNKIGIEIDSSACPLGICTSSGTVGHSLSFGIADAAIILSSSTPLADAVATATGNIILSSQDLKNAVEQATSIAGITGAIAIIGNDLAIKGAVKLVPIN
ncbi:MAG: UPF0280 family protein [Peptococcaceae bacterium]|nr:UPF0280 family protein [Peptococcaceae bacterium]